MKQRGHIGHLLDTDWHRGDKLMNALRRLVIALLCVALTTAAVAQGAPKPFILPMADPPGPSSWLFGQPYGNTVGAYNFGTAWYSAGQGLHFGIDISMPCGTPLVAVADGEVIYVDNLAFGAGPHNLILRHPEVGVTTLYGHLLNPAPVRQYQWVQRGQIVGYSGDPDVTCDSRPHLHFEVRSLDYRTAYNPVDYIAANWDALAAIGPFNAALFQIDLNNPRQWVTLHDQPPVAFGGARLNAYTFSWPPANEQRPPAHTLPARPHTPLSPTRWTLRPLSYENCCAASWWHPSDPTRFYMIDGSAGQRAGIFEWDVPTGGLLGLVGSAPPPFLSADGSHQIINAGGQIVIRRLTDGMEWTPQTGGFLPAISPDNTRILWQAQRGQFVPGAAPPPVEIWVSEISGANTQMLQAGTRLSAYWLDGGRLLIASIERTLTTLSVYELAAGGSYTLGTWDRLRGLSIAPGGQRALFYQTFQQDTSMNGVYALEMRPGAAAARLPWFGAWRWRDSESVYYIPFEPQQPTQRLAFYHLPTGEDRALTNPNTQPFIVLNGDWSVSPDGTRIAFQNAADRRIWMLEQ